MHADLILTNGAVYTVDAARSRHEAVAVKDGRLVFVGSVAGAAELCGPRTRTVDLGGRLVLPGFIDAHMHAAYAMGPLFEVDLSGCASVDECVAAVASFAAERPQAPVIRGFGWLPHRVDESAMTAGALDRVVPDRPVVLSDDSEHSMWVNGAVLRAAGVGRDDPPWDGAVVERLPDGSPSGLLREAWRWVEEAVPSYTIADHEAALRHFQQTVAAPYGITAVHESGVYPDGEAIAAYAALEARGELSVRACVSLYLEPGRPAAEQIAAAVAERARRTGPLVRAGAVKLFADGVIEAHTGYLAEPYDDRPGFRSSPIWEPAELEAVSAAAAAEGFQLHYHAIGDAAVSLSLDAVAAARPDGAAADARDMITHLQLMAPRDYGRMARLGVTAAVQPYWFMGDTQLWADCYRPFLGEARAMMQYPLRSLFDHGVLVAAASDYPVSPPPDPLLAIQRGALRRDPALGDAGFALWPEEAVSVEQLVAAFTINAAAANFLEHETGSLECGKSADLVVMSEDVLSMPPERLHEAEVLLTLFRGAPVYAGGAFAGLGDG